MTSRLIRPHWTVARTWFLQPALPDADDRFARAAASPVDVVILDLEDAVAPDDKEQARKNIIQALNEIDWGNKTMMIRINGLDTHYMYRDVVDIVEFLLQSPQVSGVFNAGSGQARSFADLARATASLISSSVRSGSVCRSATRASICCSWTPPTRQPPVCPSRSPASPSRWSVSSAERASRS